MDESFHATNGVQFLRLLERKNTITADLHAECTESARGLFVRAIIIIVHGVRLGARNASVRWDPWCQLSFTENTVKEDSTVKSFI